MRFRCRMKRSCESSLSEESIVDKKSRFSVNLSNIANVSLENIQISDTVVESIAAEVIHSSDGSQITQDEDRYVLCFFFVCYRDICKLENSQICRFYFYTKLSLQFVFKLSLSFEIKCQKMFCLNTFKFSQRSSNQQVLDMAVARYLKILETVVPQNSAFFLV